jgi:hypothetical protein
MKHPREASCILTATLLALCLYAIPTLCAEDALFIGNSYTYGGNEPVISGNGGVPKLVEVIAASKGRKLSTVMLAVGGKDWGFHLQQPKTEEDLGAKPWDWVVLQDFSTEATHAGNPDEFFKNGATFCKLIMANSPKTKIVLYETWARPKGSPFYSGKSTATTFVDAVEMNGEIDKNYTELFHRLEAVDPGEVELAPVGLAFERTLEKYPGINLSSPDLHHANVEGNYLAALVIYATIYQDSPKGATREFFGASLDAGVAAKLQEIADEVTSGKGK